MVQEEEAALKAQKPDVLQQTNDATSLEAKSLPASIATSDQQSDDSIPADGKSPAQDKGPSIQKPADVPARDTRQHHPIPAEEDDEQNRMVRPLCSCQGKHKTMGRAVEVCSYLQDVDWGAFPAQIILAQTVHASGAKLLVKRKGCSMEDYGLCDMAAARRQRLTGEGSASPVSLEMLEEWEAYQKACKMAVFNCTEDGEMDLGELCLHELMMYRLLACP